MTRLFVTVLGAALVAALHTAGAQGLSPAGERLLARAHHKATVDRDLQGAIEDYKKIVASAGQDRALAAQALLRMAECYDTLGSAEARNIYERVVREYSAQTEAATLARARLGGTAPANRRGTTARQVWTGPGVNYAGTISHDGRFLSSADPETGDLVVRDLVTGRHSRLTDVGQERAWADFVDGSAISRDGTKVAYSWWVGGQKNQLRVIETGTSRSSSPRILIDNPEISYIDPFDWSPVGDWIAVQARRVDGTAAIGVVTVPDGAFHVLKSVDWRGITRMSVSPDGRYIAYDLPAGEGSRERDVFTISRDGRDEQKASAQPGHHVVVGWTSDGRTLMFARERSGSMALWGVRVTDGKVQGAPVLVEPDLGAFYGSVGVTQSGSLFFTRKVGGLNIHTAAVDFAAGTLLESPKQITDSIIRNHPGAMWSPDGKSLAYTATDRGVHTIAIQSLETGDIREINPRVSQVQFPRWSAEGFITFQGSDLKGRQGIYRLDPGTGAVEVIAAGHGTAYLSWASASPDGKHVVYSRNQNNGFTLLRRESATGDEREIATGIATGTTVSPDGRLVAYRTGDRQTSSLTVLPIEGGQPRAILRVSRPESLAHLVEWLPDGQRLLVAKWQDSKFDRLLVVPLNGEPPIALPPAIEPTGPYLRVHRDGRRIVYSTGMPVFELWVLEDFLPRELAAPRTQ